MVISGCESNVGDFPGYRDVFCSRLVPRLVPSRHARPWGLPSNGLRCITVTRSLRPHRTRLSGHSWSVSSCMGLSCLTVSGVDDLLTLDEPHTTGQTHPVHTGGEGGRIGNGCATLVAVYIHGICEWLSRSSDGICLSLVCLCAL